MTTNRRNGWANEPVKKTAKTVTSVRVHQTVGGVDEDNLIECINPNDSTFRIEAAAGIYADGPQVVRVQYSADGRPMVALPPSDLGEYDAVGVGATGKAITNVETKQAELDEALATAQDELDKLPGMQQEAANIRAKADNATAEALARGFFYGPVAPDPGAHKQWAKTLDSDPGTLTMGVCASSSTRYMASSETPDVSAITGSLTFSVEARANKSCVVVMQRGYAYGAEDFSLTYAGTSKTLAGTDEWSTISVTVAAAAFAKVGLRFYISSTYYSAEVELRKPSIKDTDGNEILADVSFGSSWSQYNVNQPWEAKVTTPHGEGQELLRWDGDTWVPLELIGSKIIVPGTVGNILLENGGISAEKLYINDQLWASFIGAMNIAAQTGTLENLQVTSQAMVNELVGKILRAGEIHGTEIYGAYFEGGRIKYAGSDAGTMIVEERSLGGIYNQPGIWFGDSDDNEDYGGITFTDGYPYLNFYNGNDQQVIVGIDMVGLGQKSVVAASNPSIYMRNDPAVDGTGLFVTGKKTIGSDHSSIIVRPESLISHLGYLRVEDGDGSNFSASHVTPTVINQRGGMHYFTTPSNGSAVMQLGYNASTPAQSGYMLRKTDGGGDKFYAQRRGFFWDCEGGATFALANMPTTTQAANAMWDNNGNRAYKVSSRRKWKYIIHDAANEVDIESVLEIPIRTWFDKSQADERALIIERNGNRIDNGQEEQLENVPELKRILGVIAEEVQEIGLDILLTWDEHGELQGVSYDRICLLLIPIVKALKSNVAKLETEVANLKSENEVLRSELAEIRAHLGI